MRAKTRIDQDWKETDPHARIKRDHGAVLIERLNKLLATGYRIDLMRSVGAGDIPLFHPNKKMPLLAIWDDGLVNDMYPSQFLERDHARTIFEPDDLPGFNQFVARVPAPNWIEKIRISTVEEAFYVILAWSLFLGFIFAFSDVGERLSNWFRVSLA